MIAWIAIAGLAIAAIALMASHDAGSLFGIDNGDFVRLVMLSAVGLVIGLGLLREYRGNYARATKTAAAWCLLALVLMGGYTFRHDAVFVFSRMMSEVVPGWTIETAPGQVAVARSGNGHFVLDTRVNGAGVAMLFDTGASTVVLTREDAERAGIDVESLDYSAPVWTANGSTTAAPVLLDSMDVGSIAVSRVRAMVAREGALRQSLLGMSFLDRIESWTVRQDRLTLNG